MSNDESESEHSAFPIPTSPFFLGVFPISDLPFPTSVCEPWVRGKELNYGHGHEALDLDE